MLPTIKLTDIAKKWHDGIRNSQLIIDFCQSKYGKNLKIYSGMDEKRKPTEKDCPYAVIMPGTKFEGAGNPEYKYMISIAWCISNESPAAVLDDDVTQPGTSESDELGQLILAAVAEINPSYPVSDIDYDIEPLDYIPQYPGRMHLTITAPVVMGAKLEY